MRDLLTIIKEVQQHLSHRGMTEELISFREEITISTKTGRLYSNIGTWLITFQLLELDDEKFQNLVFEYVDACHAKGIYPL